MMSRANRVQGTVACLDFREMMMIDKIKPQEKVQVEFRSSGLCGATIYFRLDSSLLSRRETPFLRPISQRC